MNYSVFVSDLKKSGRIPNEIVAAVAPSPEMKKIFLFGYEVDLKVELEKAISSMKGMDGINLTVVADRVTLTAGYDFVLGAQILSIKLIARELIVGEGAKISIPEIEASLENAQLFIQTVSPEPNAKFIEFQPKQGNPSDHAYPRLLAGQGLGCTYAVRNSTLLSIVNSPTSKMIAIEPFYLPYLEASFELGLAAAASQEHQELASSILSWVLRWSPLSPELTDLSETAATVLNCMPYQIADGSLVRRIPAHKSETWKESAIAQMEIAEQQDLKENFTKLSMDIVNSVATIADTWYTRDLADEHEIKNEIKLLRDQIDATEDAIQKAKQDIKDRAFNAKLKQIALKYEIEDWKVDQKLSAGMKIFSAVGGIAGGVAEENPMEVVKEVLEITKTIKDLKEAVEEIDSVSESVKEVIKEAPSVMNAIATIVTGESTEEMIKAIRALASKTAGMPDSLFAAAAWSEFEVKSVNQLDKLKGMEDGKKLADAANDLKTPIQEMAIYGRVQAKEQGRLIEHYRSLTVLALKLNAIKEKSNVVLKLRDKELAEANAKAQAIAIQEEQLRRVKWAFCATIHKFRAAYFYENLKDATIEVNLPRTTVEITEARAAMVNDENEALTTQGDFNETIQLNEADLIENLKEQRTISFYMPLTQHELQDYNNVRVKEAQTHLIGVPQGTVDTDLIASGGYSDRDSSGSQYQFSGQSFTFGYKYNSETVPEKVDYHREISKDEVWPTAFTIWTLRINEDIDLSDLTGIEITLIGKANKD